ncbi:sigma-70 family RNA polymerase sigma factor [Actinocatenispora rupis]|uniref:RNA polymerase sigma factor n=1 Tax=Actinocatenispora rupis TaxID=519421 RepID=A0A8J3IYC7_9ACTN|nr:sigma-70 family RNA polymerase sigma factor [Actinocatenispora rupis]GID11055.1 RNA polymerase sigma factor [Actinocatenispora rupis]
MTAHRDDRRTTALALAAGAGDRAAAEEFVRATERDVWGFLAYLTDVHQADDLTQETYLRALSGLSGFAGRSSARTWLLTIARRVVVDHIRAAGRRPRLSAADWAEAADARQARRYDGAAGFEDVVALNELLGRLDDDRRQALVLTQVLGLDYAEAAAVCGCPVGTIRSRVARARTDLLDATAAEHTDIV